MSRPGSGSSSRRLSLLMVAPRLPVDHTNGVDLIAHHIVPRIAARHEVNLLAFQDRTQHTASSSDLHGFASVQAIPVDGRVTELIGALGADLARLPVRRLGRLDLDAAREMLAAVERSGCDLIHVRTATMAPFVVSRTEGPRLLELVDSPTRAGDRSGRSGPDRTARRWFGRYLERYCERFDVCTTVAEADARAVRDHARGATVEVIPNGVDTNHFQARETHSPNVRVGLHGNFTFGPNARSLAWFLDDVQPLLAATDLEYWIIGPTSANELTGRADGRSHFTGFVDDVRPYLGSLEVYLAPMVSGTGIKNKVLEAMAMGLPVVTTPLGVEALDVVNGEHCLITDSAAGFASAIERLLNDADERRRLGRAARQLVEQRYSWDTTAERYLELYDRLMGASHGA